ncbi:MAG TPA: hypothetical protein VFI11_12315 [Anaerolineales bacterium]|nr:hypothetical protein [Anaerolineales bacterium]
MVAKPQRKRSDPRLPKRLERVSAGPSSLDEAARVRRWRLLSRTLLDRIPLPLGVKAAVAFGVVLAEQALEELIWGPQAGPGLLDLVTVRLAIPLLTVYMLLGQNVLRVTVLRALVRLRPSVLVEDEEYEELVRKMIRRPVLVDIGLVLLALALEIGLYGLLDASLPLGGPLSTAPGPWQVGSIFLINVLIGWLGLSLIYTAVKHSIGLGRLANWPLIVNIYNPENLLPFGYHALLHSLALAGVIFIPSLLLGRPGSPASFLLISVNTLASLTALIAPLVGVYRQIRAAKIQALANVSAKLTQLQDALLERGHKPSESMADLSARATALVTLRKTIHESPNWPFRGTTGVVRAVAAATSPLIYVILVEAIRFFVLPWFGIPRP